MILFPFLERATWKKPLRRLLKETAIPTLLPHHKSRQKRLSSDKRENAAAKQQVRKQAWFLFCL